MSRAAGTLALAVVAALGLSAPAAAATISVTRSDDPLPDACLPTDCSLREAVIASGQIEGKDRIDLDPGTRYELALANAGLGPGPYDEDEGATGDLDIAAGELRISGPVNDPATIDANGLDRVLEVSASADATISGLMATGGSVDGSGGGVFVAPGSKLRLSRATLSNNEATLSGGALDAVGTTKIKDSTLSRNRAGTVGGGISSPAGAKLSAINSTLTRNEAGLGGGGLDASGSVDLNAVTVARNAVTGGGASPRGGGIASAPGRRIVVENSLIALNTSLAGADDCGPQELDSDGDNLTSAPCPGVDFAGDEVAANPKIRRLRANGGPTKTIALKRKSPAVNAAGPQSSPQRDQRGVRRVKLPDIGAYERETKNQKRNDR
jgi:hypothetical protein